MRESIAKEVRLVSMAPWFQRSVHIAATGFIGLSTGTIYQKEMM